MKMNLTAAIEAFNQASEPKIELLTTRDGRVVATLPRVGRKVIVEGSPFHSDVKVTAADIAALCQEARLASAPGLALLDAALGSFGELSGPAEDGPA
jgi:hypothetical protein